jgi:hypothetical protein
MDKCIRANAERVKTDPDSSALSFMVKCEGSHPRKPDDCQREDRDWRDQRAAGRAADDPLRPAHNLNQLEVVKAQGKWRAAFEEGVRRVAPIQASSWLVMEDTEIDGCFIPRGDTVMTIQASATATTKFSRTVRLTTRCASQIRIGRSVTARSTVPARTCRGGRWATFSCDAIRAVPEHEAAGSVRRALARISLPGAAEFAGLTAVRRAT